MPRVVFATSCEKKRVPMILKIHEMNVLRVVQTLVIQRSVQPKSITIATYEGQGTYLSIHLSKISAPLSPILGKIGGN